MKTLLISTVVLSAVSGAAWAGGVERTNQSMSVLFEEGRYLQFSLSAVSPDVSGVGSALGPTPGALSGDMTESYLNFGAAYKADLNDTWSYALIYDQPYGANVAYPAGTGYFAGGATAELKSNALTGILQYNLPSNVSFHAGLRVQTLAAVASLPFLAGYSVDGERDVALGYLVGAAYERPDIALRVALTYLSEIEHELDTTETGPASVSSVTPITTPQALNLEFQSGVAQDTLVFGSVRWVDWTEFSIAPVVYTGVPATLGRPLVSYDDDRTTFTLGVGRRLNETWSVSGQVSYEASTGSLTGNLGPTDGILGVGLAAVYTRDNMRVTTGISYADVGGATTRLGAGEGGIFRDNSAIGVGVRVGYTF